MAGQVTNRPLTQYSGDVNANLFLRPYIKDWIKFLNRQDTPFISLIGTAPAQPNPAIKLEWGWGNTVPDYDTLGAAISDTTGQLVTVTNANMWGVGETFRVDQENFLITAVDTVNARLTVAPRGFDGTTPATHSNGVGITRMASAIRENQDTPLTAVAQGETDFNFCQQIEESIQISHRADVIPTYESIGLNQKGSKAQREMEKKMTVEIPKLLEQTMLFGGRSAGDTGTASTCGGLLTTPSFITYRNTSLSGPLTETILMDQFQQVYQRVGNENSGKTWMCSPKVKRIISSFYNGSRRLSPSDTEISLNIEKIDTGDFGVITLMSNYWMQKSDASAGMTALDQIVAFNPKDLKRVPLASDSDWSMVALPENGWYKRAAVRGDWTLMAENPDSRMLLGGFSLNSADYPGLA